MNTTNLGRTAVFILIIIAFAAFTGDKDKLNKREFLINISEPKKPKTTADEMQFKDGKVWCGDQAFEKIGVKFIRYEVVKDSTYKDEGQDIEYIEVLASTNLEKGELFEMKCIIDNYQIEGTMRVLKADKEKKSWSFTGKEKAKPKKKK